MESVLQLKIKIMQKCGIYLFFYDFNLVDRKCTTDYRRTIHVGI